MTAYQTKGPEFKSWLCRFDFYPLLTSPRRWMGTRSRTDVREFEIIICASPAAVSSMVFYVAVDLETLCKALWALEDLVLYKSSHLFVLFIQNAVTIFHDTFKNVGTHSGKGNGHSRNDALMLLNQSRVWHVYIKCGVHVEINSTKKEKGENECSDR